MKNGQGDPYFASQKSAALALSKPFMVTVWARRPWTDKREWERPWEAERRREAPRGERGREAEPEEATERASLPSSDIGRGAVKLGGEVGGGRRGGGGFEGGDDN